MARESKKKKKEKKTPHLTTKPLKTENFFNCLYVYVCMCVCASNPPLKNTRKYRENEERMRTIQIEADIVNSYIHPARWKTKSPGETWNERGIPKKEKKKNFLQVLPKTKKQIQTLWLTVYVTPQNVYN